jgi:hypothetical protein
VKSLYLLGVVVGLGIVVAASGSPSSMPATTQSTITYPPAREPAGSAIARQMLAAVRRAAPGQFPTPESAVQFLVQQVAANDIDEASRVFPIFEFFDHADLESIAGAFNIISPNDNPMPGAPFQRAMLALRQLAPFDSLRMRLAGIDPFTLLQIQNSPENAPEAIVARLAKADALPIEILSILEKNRQSPTRATPMPYTSMAMSKVEVRRGDVRVMLEVVTMQLDGNWKIAQIQRIDR